MALFLHLGVRLPFAISHSHTHTHTQREMGSSCSTIQSERLEAHDEGRMLLLRDAYAHTKQKQTTNQMDADRMASQMSAVCVSRHSAGNGVISGDESHGSALSEISSEITRPHRQSIRSTDRRAACRRLNSPSRTFVIPPHQGAAMNGDEANDNPLSLSLSNNHSANESKCDSAAGALLGVDDGSDSAASLDSFRTKIPVKNERNQSQANEMNRRWIQGCA